MDALRIVLSFKNNRYRLPCRDARDRDGQIVIRRIIDAFSRKGRLHRPCDERRTHFRMADLQRQIPRSANEHVDERDGIDFAVTINMRQDANRLAGIETDREGFVGDGSGDTVNGLVGVSKSGNDLVFTKQDGTTVTITLPEGGTCDLSNYYTKSQVDLLINGSTPTPSVTYKPFSVYIRTATTAAPTKPSTTD